MAVTWSMRRRVAFRDTDAAGIAHFSVFFTWMEDAEHAFLREHGLSVVTHDEQGEISWPRVSARCDYRAAVKFEDEVEIELAVERVGRSSVSYAVRFLHGERLVAEGQLVAVCCRMRAGQPPQAIDIPPTFRAALVGHE